MSYVFVPHRMTRNHDVLVSFEKVQPLPLQPKTLKGRRRANATATTGKIKSEAGRPKASVTNSKARIRESFLAC